MKDRKYLHFDNLRIGAKSRGGRKLNFASKALKPWYKYYSGGWCTWPTPLKYAESKFKYTEA